MLPAMLLDMVIDHIDLQTVDRLVVLIQGKHGHCKWYDKCLI